MKIEPAREPRKTTLNLLKTGDTFKMDDAYYMMTDCEKSRDAFAPANIGLVNLSDGTMIFKGLLTEVEPTILECKEV